MSLFINRIKTFTKLSVFALSGMHAMNKAIESSAQKNALLTTNEGEIYHWSYGDIFFQTFGQGAPMLLLHDLNPASSGYEWHEMIDFLSKNHRIYVIDLPGCGRSDKPELEYGSFLYTKMILDFIREVVHEPAAIMATGLSSAFAAAASVMNSDLVTDITMIHPYSMAYFDQMPTKKSKFLRHLISLPIIGTSIYYWMVSRMNVEYQMTETYYHNPFHVSQKLIETYYEAAHIGSGRGKYLMASLDGCYYNMNLRNIIRKSTSNIHIIMGNHEINAKEIASGYQKANSSIQVTYVDRASCLPQLESPDQLNRIFVSRETL